VRVRQLFIAVDVGLAINPDGVANQIEGGAIQAASWTLLESVRFDRERITSDAWERYPILRFSQVPAVHVEVLQQPEAPPLGAGEAAHGPTAAAIANAVFDALGARVRDLPITRERLVTLLA
jgi:CO/xanthine dehydrogenase Mo-binding subunit